MELRAAELVRLAPEEQFGQKSSIVLLHGKLRAMGHAADVPLADRGQPEGSERSKGKADDGFEVRVQFEGPAVVPWLWKVCGCPAMADVGYIHAFGDSMCTLSNHSTSLSSACLRPGESTAEGKQT